LALARAGKFNEAIAQYEAALRIQPNQAQVHNNFGNALRQTGRLPEAIGHYEEALRIEPKSVSALTNLALIRAADADPRVRNGAEAVRLAERACSVSGPSNLVCLDTLAAAYAEAQRFDEAVTTAEQAVALARSARQEAIAEAIQSRLALYRDRRPYRVVAIPKAPGSN
jgi:tetratricopeptide (TPR) repeat protein